MRVSRRIPGLLAVAALLLPAGAHANELLVMPYACTMAGGQPLLTPGPEQGHRIIGQRDQRRFSTCSPVNPDMCRQWTVHRFDMDCDGVPVPWVSVVAATNEGSRRAWLLDGRLVLRMGPRWSLPPGDPCAREPEPGERFGWRRMRRYCADRLAIAPPPVVELPFGYAPLLGINGIFVKAAPNIGAQPPLPPIAAAPSAGSRAGQAPPDPMAELFPPPAASARPETRPDALDRETPAGPAPPPRTAVPQPQPPPRVAAAPPAVSEAAKAAPAESRPAAGEARPAPKTAVNAPPPRAGKETPAAHPAPPPRAVSETPKAAPVTAQPAAPKPPKAAVASPPPPKAIEQQAPQAAEPQGGASSISLFSVFRTTTVGALVAFGGLALGLLTAFALARRNEHARDSRKRPRDLGAVSLDDRRPKPPARIGNARGNLPPNAAASAMSRVPGRNAVADAATEWGDRMPQTREEALKVLGIGVAPTANEAAIKKIVDGLRHSWHPDLAKDEADRTLRELRSKQINAAWELLRSQRAVV